MSQTKNIGPLFIFIAALLWAFDGILRRSLYSLPAPTIVFYEHLIGALILLPLIFRQLRKLKFTKELFVALIWISVLSGVAGTILFTAALAQTNFIPFSVVFLLQKLQPLFAVGTGHLVLKEKITPTYIKWALPALVAAYFVTFPNGQVNFGAGNGQIIAAFMALGAAFAWGSSTAFSRLGLLQLNATLMTGLRFLFTTPLALFVVFIFNQTNSITQITSDQLLKLILIAFSTGMVALWIYYKGLKTTQVKVSTIIELSFPLVAIFIDIFLYQTTLAPSQYLAAMALLFCMYQVTKPTLSKKPSPAANH